MNLEIAEILKKCNSELDQLYREGTADRIPRGVTKGTAIIFPGTLWARILAKVAWWIGWQGKVFDLFAAPDKGVLVNSVSPFRRRLIVAQVYKGESWFDGKETIIIDYSFTSLVARIVRDEIREVKPGLYLGKVWLRRSEFIHFALEWKGAEVKERE